MKKLSLIFGLALGMLTVGCSQDFADDKLPVNGDTVTLGVSLEEGVRTSLGGLSDGKYAVLWSAGDKLAVNGVTSSAVADAQVGTSYAQFTVEGVLPPYNVLYPAEALNADGTSITIATEQVYTPGSFANGNAVLVGYSQDGNVAAKHLYSFVKVNIVKGTEDVAIKSVTVKALGGEAISGTFDVDFQNATITPAAGQDLVRVSSAEGVAIGSGLTFVVAVPAGSYSAGFEVTIADVNGKGMTRKVTNAALANVPGGIIVNMPALPYAPEVPVSAATPITTAAQLKAFLDAVAAGDFSAYVMDNGEVVLGSDIDLTGVTLTPPEKFTGVFNGQGYALKNWTTTRGLFNMNFGTVKNVVVDKSCTLTPDGSTKNIGFIVEDIDADTAVVTGCVNYGTINATDVSFAECRIGGVVGVSYGFMDNCVNYGKISVTSQTINNAQFVGGVVGYANPTTGSKAPMGQDFLANCINYGEVNVLFPCRPGKAYVGGVLGATIVVKSTTTEYAGQIKNCSNLGKVSYRFETLDSGTYGNVGGVVGYSSATMEGCDNHGEVSFTTPYKNTEAGGTRPALGGVVGSCVFSVKDCNNYGKVTGEGRWAAGTQDAAGSGSQGGSSFGGVVGCSGTYKVYNADYPVENCNNYGEVNIFNHCKAAGGTNGYHAGVVAYTSNDVKNCHNYGKVNIKHNTYKVYSAGVVGEAMGVVEGCSCDAPVTIQLVDVSKAGGDSYLAGVVGYSTGSVKNCHLNADFTATTNNASGSLRFAGVVGQVKTAAERCVTVSNCTVKKGVKLSFTTDNDKANYCAGVAALSNNGISGCVNGGDIEIKITEVFEDTDVTYLGGVAAAQKEDMTDCTNNGNLSIDMFGSTGPFYAATVLANNKAGGIGGDATFGKCHNTGNLTVTNAGNTANVGLYIGCQDEGTGADFSACTNSGTVTVNGTVLQ